MYLRRMLYILRRYFRTKFRLNLHVLVGNRDFVVGGGGGGGSSCVVGGCYCGGGC